MTLPFQAGHSQVWLKEKEYTPGSRLFHLCQFAYSSLYSPLNSGAIPGQLSEGRGCCGSGPYTGASSPFWQADMWKAITQAGNEARRKFFAAVFISSLAPKID